MFYTTFRIKANLLSPKCPRCVLSLLADSLMPPHAISVLHTNLTSFPLQTSAQAVLLYFEYSKQVLSQGELGIVPVCSRKAFSFHIGHVSCSHAFGNFFFCLPPKHVQMDHDLFQNSHCPFISCSSLPVLFLTEQKPKLNEELHTTKTIGD